MATFSIDDLHYDQSPGVQTGTDGDEVDVTLSSGELDGLDSGFEAFLTGLGSLITSDMKNYAVANDAASSADNTFITVTADTGETLNDLKLSASSSTPLTGFKTLDGGSIYVHVDSSGNYATLWTTSDDTGHIVGALALYGETIDNTTTHTATAGVQMVFFEPIQQTDTTSQDESISLSDILKISVSSAVSFNFEQLDAGNFLWAAVGDADSAMLITGQDLNVKDSGSPAQIGNIVTGGADGSDTVNTSKASDTTIGILAQHFAPTNSGDGATGVFTFVNGLASLEATTPFYTGDNVKEIDYDDYLNVSSASIFISQVTGSGDTLIHFSLWEAGGGEGTAGVDGTDHETGDLVPEEGYTGVNSYIGNQDDDTHLKDDCPVNVASVIITRGGIDYTFNSSGTNLTIGVTVTIDGNDVIVEGALKDDAIKLVADDDPLVDEDGTFNRIDIQALEGSAAFDIGHIDLIEGGLTSAPLGTHLFADDDGPSLGPINENIVDFAQGNSVTDSLNGDTGTDTNASPYTLVDWTESVTVNGVLMTGVPNDDTDPTSVIYYADTDESGIFGDGTDIGYFQLSLDQDDNTGAGSYTFAVLQDPPSSSTPFVFTDLPSGQNLCGIIASDKADLGKGGLLVFPTNPDLNPVTGAMTNISGTINTSKGGGPVTIGNGNQAFDHNFEGAWFVYVDDPASSAVGGLGLTQTSADDADTIDFTGTIEVDDASVTIVQASGKGTLARPGPSMHITTYDIDPGDVSGTDGRDLVNDPTAVGGGADQVGIIGVKILDANGNVIEYRIYDGTASGDLQDSDDSGTGISAADDSLVGITFVVDDPGADPDPAAFEDDICSITVSNLKANYTVEFITDGDHDAAKVENVSGSFDIGGFDLIQNNDTPDVVFEFTAQATDGDGDTVQACWEVGVDGTGSFDGDNTLDTTVTGIEPGQPSDCVLETSLATLSALQQDVQLV